MPEPSDYAVLARFIALHGVRNSELENLHAGTGPSSVAGDFSDVQVVSPYGPIPWLEVSRISDAEMRVLMLGVEQQIEQVLRSLFPPSALRRLRNRIEQMRPVFFGEWGISWDIPAEKWAEWNSPPADSDSP